MAHDVSAIGAPSVVGLAGSVLDVLLPAYQGAAEAFTAPRGAPALFGPDSLHWRVFKNPVTVYIGGMAAVVLELAEPKVRTGVWQHSRFRIEPVRRLHHTGHAALVSVYGAASAAEGLAGRVGDLHRKVQGVTVSGEPYRATDPDLLRWVQATSSFGFVSAYSRYALSLGQRAEDRFHTEAAQAAHLYGVQGAPRTAAAVRALLNDTAPRLETSETLRDFLDLMRSSPIMPTALRSWQPLFVRAAIEVLPPWLQGRLKLRSAGLKPGERLLIGALAGAADRIPLRANPAVMACRRLGLPPDYLFRPSRI